MAALVEVGSSGEVIGAPAHPYTRGLLASRITRIPKGVRLVTIPGSPPDLADPPPGCPFAPRCTWRAGLRRPPPARADALAPGHAARCIRVEAAA